MAEQVPIPKTIGRLSQSCSIYTTPGGNVDLTNLLNGWLTTNDMQASSALDPAAFLALVQTMLGTNKPVGSVDKIEIAQTREIERIYSIGSYAFEPYRMVPKAIKTRLTLSNIVLNDDASGDFLSKPGFSSWNLYYQQAPFIIRQDLVNPQTGNEPVSILYFDCWIAENPCTFDLGPNNANLVRQQIVIDCGRIMSSASSYYSGSQSTRKVNRGGTKF